MKQCFELAETYQKIPEFIKCEPEAYDFALKEQIMGEIKYLIIGW